MNAVIREGGMCHVSSYVRVLFQKTRWHDAYSHDIILIMSGHRLKAEERKQQIIENAARVFAARGLEGARTRDIAKACGINEAILYRHFQSKQDLFHEVNSFLHRNAMESWRVITASAPDGLSALRAVIRTHCIRCLEKTERSASMVQAAAGALQDKSMREIYGTWLISDHAFLTSLVARGIADGSIRSDLDPGKVALTVLGLHWQACILKVYELYDGRMVSNPEELFDTLLEHISAPMESAETTEPAEQQAEVDILKATGS